MKKILPSLALFLAVLTISNATYAETPTFTYIELEYIASGDFEISDGSLSAAVDLDGYALNVSLELGMFFLQLSRFELESDDVFGSNLEDSISTAALGITIGFPQTAIYALARARRDELSLSGDFFDDEEEDGTSLGVEAGVRINITDRFEVNANIGLPDLDDGKSYGIGAQFFITKNLGITLDFSSIEVEDDDLSATFDTSSIGLRYNF